MSVTDFGSTDWIDQRLAQRRWAARQRVAAQNMVEIRKRRRWWRDMARAALAISLIVLGVLMVEIGRKAITVTSHTATAASVAELPQVY